MQSITQLETTAATQPNSIEIHQALADRYAEQGRWQEAARAYQALVALYPATGLLFTNRIRLGAVALTVASLLILLAEILQPPILDVQASPTNFSIAVNSWGFLSAQMLFALAFPLWSTAAISIYKLLSYSTAHRPAFWAMVLSVIGVGLSMPALGINAIVLPQIGRLYLEGQASTLNVYLAMQAWPWPLVLRFGGFLLVMGLAIFNWVIWRNPNFPKIPATLFLAGWVIFVASGNQLSKTGLLTVGLLVVLGGIWLARIVWIQAAFQFTPLVES
jgi:hypothetical protein